MHVGSFPVSDGNSYCNSDDKSFPWSNADSSSTMT